MNTEIGLKYNPPKVKKMQQFSIEEITLISVFAVSYIASMYTQYSDPKITLIWNDWIISFLWSFIGGFMAYNVFSYTEENPGKVMVYTVVISIVSPRAFRFLSSSTNQERLIESIFSRFAGKKSNKEEEDGRN